MTFFGAPGLANSVTSGSIVTQFAVTLFLVHFEGAATLFDFFLKAYFAPAEACTALVKTARKVRRRVSCRFSPTPPRRSS